ncbi:lytic transglycosylase domain-containing protein [Azospirillum picis]|uniref:Soluble lytic murein transglycosylase-like protein n=1 Tax=Azospirillum picis TaxID=488438 RepID=A0ABU0MUU4_9PROT|nr:lytic transglycosylase domain-containing protein [Azospirillum picis]MBP2303282.1 soluble lytic murein transglycosylase-like protein [Azospirillum picis]MDQ0537094.1 soluble lytic murein transglycosylase-like protein [Azospirillum picis]
MLGLAVAYTLGPDGAVGLRPACAALIIHAPDGHAVVPPGPDSVPDPSFPPLEQGASPDHETTAGAAPGEPEATDAAVQATPDAGDPEAAGPGVAIADMPLLLATDAYARTVQLGEEDAERYRRIFALQERADWSGADAEMEKLTDRRLVGYVLRQRYLHPDRRAAYEELARWMQEYGDLAGAERIHGLAQKRQPAGQRAPKPPRGAERVRLVGSLERLGGLRTVAAGDESDGEDGDSVTVAPRSRTVTRARSDRAAVARVEELLRGGRTAQALSLLGQDDFGGRLDPVQYDATRSRIAAALYYSGESAQALTLASASAARSGEMLPEAHWIAGLAAWRMQQVDRAARHFRAMAEAAPRSPWKAAAADYWAARALTRKGKTDEAAAHLAAAARYPHTFYGLIALRTLDRLGEVRWQAPDLSGRQLSALAATLAGARAIALMQAGQRELAGLELQRVDPQGDRLVEQAMVALADRAGLPTLSLRLGNAVAGPDGAPYAAALYPLPSWKPRDGFAIDRALVFAVMRQESRFDPRLVSSAGATGLMQILPSTAQHVQERNADIGREDAGRDALFDPARNMELGQRYLSELLGMPDIDGSLFLAAAAYNAGPGTLLRWRRDLSDISDPLLFIESLPFGETRDYVEKVMANFWIYRLRLGQETASLDAVAEGKWPVYTAVEARRTQVAAQPDILPPVKPTAPVASPTTMPATMPAATTPAAAPPAAPSPDASPPDAGPAAGPVAEAVAEVPAASEASAGSSAAAEQPSGGSSPEPVAEQEDAVPIP